MTPFPVAPGVLRRSLTVEQVIEKFYDQWNDAAHRSHEASVPEPRENLREAVLAQFRAHARRIVPG